jgi:pyruvoyl-dependent arginine decarboxylase (PvlArgDC)
MALEGMRLRMREIKDVQSIAVEHRVQKVGATLAAVVLWDREDVR